MTTNQVAEIPVVNTDGNYEGMISLYAVLANKELSIKELTEVLAKPVLENTDIHLVMKEINKNQTSILPIISEADRLVGIVDRKQLFQALHQIYESKSGEA